MPKTEPKLTKAQKAEAAAAVAAAEADVAAEAELGTLAAMSEKLNPVAKALHAKVRIAGLAGAIEGSWSNSVLRFVKWAVTEGIDMVQAYAHIEDHLANSVGDIARIDMEEAEAERLRQAKASIALESGLKGKAAEAAVAEAVEASAARSVGSVEGIGKLTELAQKAISALNGPFFDVAVCVADDAGRLLFLDECKAKKATWGKVRTYARDIVDDLAHDEARHDLQLHYKPRNGAKITFTVGKAAKERDTLKDVQALAESIHEEWSPCFKVVRKHYREGRTDIAMPDARTTAERDQHDAAVYRAMINKHGAEKVAELLTTEA